MATKESRENTVQKIGGAGQKFIEKIQNVRKLAHAHVDSLWKKNEARPDDCRKAQKKLQELLEKYVGDVKAVTARTKQEVLQ